MGGYFFLQNLFVSNGFHITLQGKHRHHELFFLVLQKWEILSCMHPRNIRKCLKGLRRDIWNGLALLHVTRNASIYMFYELGFHVWISLGQGKKKKEDFAAKNSTRKPVFAKGKYEECFWIACLVSSNCLNPPWQLGSWVHKHNIALLFDSYQYYLSIVRTVHFVIARKSCTLQKMFTCQDGLLK